ncbi:hypothetical protein OI69_06635 [Pectobacterium fontis]|uniref:Uncharacterized protein n=1 Tax=Pectobacterium fontis TaxID=2558042 RepID=A0A7V8IK48_9GAMM|nr:hypothetical protein OI69_06635 [Pectobacterium fontis]
MMLPARAGLGIQGVRSDETILKILCLWYQLVTIKIIEILGLVVIGLQCPRFSIIFSQIIMVLIFADFAPLFFLPLCRLSFMQE